MNHIMMDIETLDTRDSAVVLSIGAIKFTEIGLGEVFYRTLNIDQQTSEGRTVSGSTIKWWVQQSEPAKAAAFKQDWDAREVLYQLNDFMADDEYQVWGNGAVFDNAIVTSLYNTYNIKRPWSYKNDRCYRTLRAWVKEQFPHADIDVEVGVAHNALDDAVSQAQSLQKIWLVMKGVEL